GGHFAASCERVVEHLHDREVVIGVTFAVDHLEHLAVRAWRRIGPVDAGAGSGATVAQSPLVVYDLAREAPRLTAVEGEGLACERQPMRPRHCQKRRRVLPHVGFPKVRVTVLRPPQARGLPASPSFRVRCWKFGSSTRRCWNRPSSTCSLMGITD